MPILSSGRRIEFSLDRFHALLAQIDIDHAQRIADALKDPDDLLLILDAVQFRMDDRQPFFANFVAADWEHYCADWHPDDREELRAWFNSDNARHYRANAIADIKRLMSNLVGSHPSLPYVTHTLH